ncbi:MAG: ROK family protein [Ferruginibacter sp.]
MVNPYISKFFFTVSLIVFTSLLSAQTSYVQKIEKSSVYAGIEVGSKGVKMSLLEINANDKENRSYHVMKDTSINTDFISFTQPTYLATLNALNKLYEIATVDFKIPGNHVFTAVSSGVKIQATKENKLNWIDQLIGAFKFNYNEPDRKVTVIDVLEEARLSHLGIVPDSRRYNTFLIDIGSGNTKGGYFPNGNTKTFKLFQLSWGTKSTSNATDKRADGNNSIENFNKNLNRVLQGAENTEIAYAVNESGSYPLSDNVAFSGGIAWALSTLMYPELIDNAVVPVSYNEVVKFYEKILNSHTTLSDFYIVKSLTDKTLDAEAIGQTVKNVNKVFDQKSLLAGTGLLLKIMRQFESANERKNFYFVRNGAVGWITAYVNQNFSN